MINDLTHYIDRLRSSGLRPTKQRLALCKVLFDRKETQPLNWPTAGSTFRNPKDNFAAKLIEECGLKGFQIGGAQN